MSAFSSCRAATVAPAITCAPHTSALPYAACRGRLRPARCPKNAPRQPSQTCTRKRNNLGAGNSATLEPKLRRMATRQSASGKNAGGPAPQHASRLGRPK